MDAPDYKYEIARRNSIVIALSYDELVDARSRGWITDEQAQAYMAWAVAQGMRAPVVGTIFGAGTK